jgi:formylglycine-generating enzyme required for sulfatase activity
MGSNNTYPEEAWAKPREVNGFWMDNTEVTVAQFSKFVEATGYITEPERKKNKASDSFDNRAQQEAEEALDQPGGAAFIPQASQMVGNLNWWRWVFGANWRFPEGPDKPAAKPNQPVSQITYNDAMAYAEWVGGRLPTEAEWEYAALAGRKNADIGPNTPRQVNAWQGVFPMFNTEDDGFKGVAPVACFEPNGFGLYDMIGNVWEWTADTYSPNHAQNAVYDTENNLLALDQYTSGKANPILRVIKGGSYLCAENYCRRYRPAARHAQEADLSTNHIGFRVVYDSGSK